MDTYSEATAEDDSSFEIPLSERKLVTQSYDLAVGTLVEQWTDGTLSLPEIQREYVWTDSKASRLIESLLLNVPIPVLYFAEAADGRYEVIDGHQRVRSVVRFINNEFKLTGLKVMADAEHKAKRFHQLPPGDQRRIRTRVMRAIIITEESHPSMKFEVFERLNTGSIALNAQEIRNSTHRGPFMNLVKKQWVMDPNFRKAIGTKTPRPRMVDHELIIRFLALRENLSAYKPPLPRFLNNYCAEMNRASTEKHDMAGAAFRRAAENVNILFGSRAFRLDQARSRSVFNRGLAEAQLVTLSYADPKDVAENRSIVLPELELLHNDPDFLDNVQRAIVDRTRTLGRMRQYREVCEEVGLTLNS